MTRRLIRVALFVGITLAVLAPAAAWADGTPTYPTPGYPTPSTPETPQCVYPYPDPAACTSPSGSGSSSQGSSLPFTGGDVALLTVFGVVVVGGGITLIVLSRRRHRRTVTT